MTPTLSPSSRPSRRAFTLIELLTVIAIIGVLAAIIIPVVGRVRNSARNAACISNLRQYGMAFAGFAQENRGKLPLGDSNNKWFDQLRPYVAAQSRVAEALLRCPGFEARLAEYYPDPNDSNAQARRGYQYNRNLDSVRIEQVRQPSLTPILWDTPGTNKDVSGYPGGGSYAARKYRHGGKANLLMVSGSVTSRPGNYDADETVKDTDLPYEAGGIDWSQDARPFYWQRK